MGSGELGVRVSVHVITSGFTKRLCKLVPPLQRREPQSSPHKLLSCEALGAFEDSSLEPPVLAFLAA